MFGGLFMSRAERLYRKLAIEIGAKYGKLDRLEKIRDYAEQRCHDVEHAKDLQWSIDMLKSTITSGERRLRELAFGHISPQYDD